MFSENLKQPGAQKGVEKPKRAPNPKVAVTIKGKIHRLMQGSSIHDSPDYQLLHPTSHEDWGSAHRGPYPSSEASTSAGLISIEPVCVGEVELNREGCIKIPCTLRDKSSRGSAKVKHISFEGEIEEIPHQEHSSPHYRPIRAEPRTPRQKRPHSAGNCLDYSQEDSSALIESILKELQGINKIQEELWDLRLHLTSVRGSVEEVSSCVDAMLLEIEGMRSDSKAHSGVSRRTKVRSRDTLRKRPVSAHASLASKSEIFRDFPPDVVAGARTRREGLSSLDLQDPQDYPSPTSLSSRYSSKSESDLEAEACWDLRHDDGQHSTMWPQASYSVQGVNIWQGYSTEEHEYYGHEQVWDCCGSAPGRANYNRPQSASRGKRNPCRQRTQASSKEPLKFLKVQTCSRPDCSSEEGQEEAFYRPSSEINHISDRDLLKDQIETHLRSGHQGSYYASHVLDDLTLDFVTDVHLCSERKGRVCFTDDTLHGAFSPGLLCDQFQPAERTHPDSTGQISAQDTTDQTNENATFLHTDDECLTEMYPTGSLSPERAPGAGHPPQPTNSHTESKSPGTSLEHTGHRSFQEVLLLKKESRRLITSFSLFTFSESGLEPGIHTVMPRSWWRRGRGALDSF